MSVEFRVTSQFSDLKEIAYERNASEEWRELFEVKPSVGRIVKLRGRLPGEKDISDILYDLSDFAGIQISQEELLKYLSKLAELEATYYPLAENLGAGAALSCGLYERVPDFIDIAKEQTAQIVWNRWKPQQGEDFIDLHRRVIGCLKRHLPNQWNRTIFHQPFSHVENYHLDHSTIVFKIEVDSPQVRPVWRLRLATRHLSLPSVIAGIDRTNHLEKIASLALMGYYPDGRGFTGVAKDIGVKRDTLSEALDRAAETLIHTQNGIYPHRRIREIVDELSLCGAIHYPSGKNVERTNPRLKLLQAYRLSPGLSPMEKNIVSLAVARKGGSLTYSSEDIAARVGVSKTVVCRIIKKVVAAGIEPATSSM